jgi:hypothetical protein
VRRRRTPPLSGPGSCCLASHLLTDRRSCTGGPVAFEVVSGDPHRAGLITLYISRVPTQKKLKKLCNFMAGGMPQVGGWGSSEDFCSVRVASRRHGAVDFRMLTRVGRHSRTGQALFRNSKGAKPPLAEKCRSQRARPRASPPAGCDTTAWCQHPTVAEVDHGAVATRDGEKFNGVVREITGCPLVALF